MNNDKMYICVLDTVPDYIVPTLVAHATLRHHLFEVAGNLRDYDRYISWVHDSFKKCVVSVNQKEFDKIRLLPNIVESFENKTLNGDISCVTVIAHKDEFNVLKFAKFWKPRGI